MLKLLEFTRPNSTDPVFVVSSKIEGVMLNDMGETVIVTEHMMFAVGGTAAEVSATIEAELSLSNKSQWAEYIKQLQMDSDPKGYAKKFREATEADILRRGRGEIPMRYPTDEVPQ